MQRNTTAARLRKTGESATTALNPELRGGKVPTVHKTQRREREKRGIERRRGGNSITSASSFTGQRDREPEL